VALKRDSDRKPKQQARSRLTISTYNKEHPHKGRHRHRECWRRFCKAARRKYCRNRAKERRQSGDDHYDQSAERRKDANENHNVVNVFAFSILAIPCGR